MDEQPTYTALDALSDLEATRRNVAIRAVAPWWYHAGIGVPLGLLTLAIGLDARMRLLLGSVILALVAIALCVTANLKRNGLWVGWQQAGRLGRRAWGVTGALVLVGIVVSLPGQRGRLQPTIAVGAAVWVALAYSVGGWLTDRAIRADLLEGAARR